MPSPHWPPTTLITESRQPECNTLRRSMATCPAISWGGTSKRLPECTTPLGGGRYGVLEKLDVRFKTAISAQYSSFSQFPSAFSVSHFLPLTFFPLNIPLSLVCSTALLLYLYISICVCLSVYLSLCASQCLVSLSHPSPLSPALPPLLWNSQRASWSCPYQSVLSPCGSWDERNALCALEHPLWHY